MAKLTAKEKGIFFFGVVVALSGGFISNVAVTTLFRFLDKNYSFINIFLLVISIISLFVLVFYAFRKAVILIESK